MMLLHKDHDYSDANTLIKPAKIMLERSRQCCDNLSQEIDVISKNIHQVISKLNSDTNVNYL